MNNNQRRMSPILSIGDLVADLIVSIPHLPAEAGKHQAADDIRLEPGGGANFLIAGARLGHPMAAIGTLGDDAWGRMVAGILRSEGIDLSGVRHSGVTTLVIVLVGQQGEHVFLGKYGHGDKIDLRPADVARIKQCGAMYCAGYTLCEHRLVDLAMESMQLARQFGRPIFFDPGPQMADVPAAVREQVLSLVNTLLLTEEEIPLLTDGGLAALLRAGPEQVVVKRGANGCTLYTADQPESATFPGYPVTVRDTVAAGDSFNAAFIAARLWGWPPADCARLANAVGAAKVQKLGGGRNVPTRAEVQAVVQQFEVEIRKFPNQSPIP